MSHVRYQRRWEESAITEIESEKATGNREHEDGERERERRGVNSKLVSLALSCLVRVEQFTCTNILSTGSPNGTGREQSQVRVASASGSEIKSLSHRNEEESTLFFFSLFFSSSSRLLSNFVDLNNLLSSLFFSSSSSHSSCCCLVAVIYFKSAVVAYGCQWPRQTDDWENIVDENESDSFHYSSFFLSLDVSRELLYRTLSNSLMHSHFAFIHPFIDACEWHSAQVLLVMFFLSFSFSLLSVQCWCRCWGRFDFFCPFFTLSFFLSFFSCLSCAIDHWVAFLKLVAPFKRTQEVKEGTQLTVCSSL